MAAMHGYSYVLPVLSLMDSDTAPSLSKRRGREKMKRFLTAKTESVHAIKRSDLTFLLLQYLVHEYS
jgi:hypothetical protein